MTFILTEITVVGDDSCAIRAEENTCIGIRGNIGTLRVNGGGEKEEEGKKYH